MACISNLCLEVRACPPKKEAIQRSGWCGSCPGACGWRVSLLSTEDLLWVPTVEQHCLVSVKIFIAIHCMLWAVKRSPEPVLTSAKHKLLITVLFRSLPFNSLDLTRKPAGVWDLECSHMGVFREDSLFLLSLFFLIFISVKKRQYERNQNIL